MKECPKHIIDQFNGFIDKDSRPVMIPPYVPPKLRKNTINMTFDEIKRDIHNISEELVVKVANTGYGSINELTHLLYWYTCYMLVMRIDNKKAIDKEVRSTVEQLNSSAKLDIKHDKYKCILGPKIVYERYFVALDNIVKWESSIDLDALNDFDDLNVVLYDFHDYSHHFRRNYSDFWDVIKHELKEETLQMLLENYWVARRMYFYKVDWSAHCEDDIDKPFKEARNPRNDSML